MSIIKIGKKRGDQYAVITRHTLQNKELSWEARGMLAYLLSKPEDWHVRDRKSTRLNSSH